MRARRAYDAAISNWLAGEIGEPRPAWRAFGGKLVNALRYGENPHQTAGFYVSPEARAGVGAARQVQGKELSYNNINDTDAAYELAAEFDPAASAAVAIIKHANPCGVAVGASLLEAYEKALQCDPVSAFGGVVALNRKLDAAAARKIVEIFTEVIIAPDADEDAMAIVAAQEEFAPAARRRPARSEGAGRHGAQRRRRPAGAGARQRRARCGDVEDRHQAGADRAAKWTICVSPGRCASTSNRTPSCSRATARRSASAPDRCHGSIPTRIAVAKAHDVAKERGEAMSPLIGSVVASDAFFPFADGVEAAAAAGATAIIQPGGAMRDAEIIAAADKAGVAMVFTGMRHFRH